jgi:hypothetical protein
MLRSDILANRIMSELLPIGVVLTFIGTLISIYYSRKNLKTTKYIDTVTSDRIKQLSMIRTIVAVLISKLSIGFDILEIESKSLRREIGMMDYYEDNDDEYYAAGDVKIELVFSEANNSWTKEELIKNLYWLKLWIDDEQYSKLFELIDYFIALFEHKSLISEQETKEANKKLILLLKETHNLISNELKIIKDETRGKINGNEIEWGIIGKPIYKTYKYIKYLIIKN